MDCAKIKVVLLGEIGAGKTSLFLQFAEGSFFEKNMPQLEDPVKSREFPMDDARVAIEVWDTADTILLLERADKPPGHEAFRAVTASHFRGADGVALVFDLSSKDSFDALDRWNEECDAIVKRPVKKILIGTKCDLPPAVSREEAETFATNHSMAYFECSAKTGVGVIEAFVSLARECRRFNASQNRSIRSSPSGPLRSSGGPTLVSDTVGSSPASTIANSSTTITTSTKKTSRMCAIQ